MFKKKKASKLFNRTKRRKRRLTSKQFLTWSLEFTKSVIIQIVILWTISNIFSMIILVYAINRTGNFSYLDTFISENHSTFRDIVGIALIKFCIENVFKYNDFGGKAKSYSINDEEESSEE